MKARHPERLRGLKRRPNNSWHMTNVANAFCVASRSQTGVWPRNDAAAEKNASDCRADLCCFPPVAAAPPAAYDLGAGRRRE